MIIASGGIYAFWKVKMSLFERNLQRAVLGNASSISQGLSPAQSRVPNALSPCSILSLHPAKPHSLQGTVLLCSALHILAFLHTKQMTMTSHFDLHLLAPPRIFYWNLCSKPSTAAETKTPLTDMKPSGCNDHIICSCFKQL